MCGGGFTKPLASIGGTIVGSWAGNEFLEGAGDFFDDGVGQAIGAGAGNAAANYFINDISGKDALIGGAMTGAGSYIAHDGSTTQEAGYSETEFGSTDLGKSFDKWSAGTAFDDAAASFNDVNSPALSGAILADALSGLVLDDYEAPAGAGTQVSTQPGVTLNQLGSQSNDAMAPTMQSLSESTSQNPFGNNTNTGVSFKKTVTNRLTGEQEYADVPSPFLDPNFQLNRRKRYL